MKKNQENSSQHSKNLLVTILVRLIFPILLSCFVFSCKKEEKPFFLEINSILLDEAQKIPVTGATVKLYVQELNTGVYNSAYTKKAELLTDANGKIGLRFEQGDAVNYRLDISRDKYFFKSFEFNSKEIKPDQPYNKDILIMPEAYVQVKITNKNPFNVNDKITVAANVKKSDCDCCVNQSFTYTGMTDTSYTCLLYGPSEYKLSWSVTRQNNNNISFASDTVFCEALKTTVFEINY